MHAYIGTENVALIAGLGAASHIAIAEADLTLIHMLDLKLRLIRKLSETFGPQVYK